MSRPDLLRHPSYRDPSSYTNWHAVERFVDRGLEGELRGQLHSLHDWIRLHDPTDPNHHEYPYVNGLLNTSGTDLLAGITVPMDFGSSGVMRTATAADAMRIFNMTLYSNPDIKIGPDKLIRDYLDRTRQLDAALFDTPAEQSPELVARALVAHAVDTFRRLTTQDKMKFTTNNPFTIMYVGDGNGITRKFVSDILAHEYPEIFSVLSNVCVDSGATMRSKQEKIRVDGVREVFISDSVVNMAHLSDRSIRGVVYIMEVLDDAAPATWIKKQPTGSLEEILFAWSASSYHCEPSIYPMEVVTALDDNSIEKMLYDYMYYQLHPMAESVGIPVSVYVPLIMSEVNRVVDAGSVYIVDYTGGFMVSPHGSEFMENLIPMRWVLTPEQLAANWVNYADEIGTMGLTSDVDPMLAVVSGQWNGFEPTFVGLYGTYIAEHVKGYSRSVVKGMMNMRSNNLFRYRDLDQKIPHGVEYAKRKFIRGLVTGRPAPITRDLIEALNLQVAASGLKAVDPAYWTVAMDIPADR